LVGKDDILTDYWNNVMGHVKLKVTEVQTTDKEIIKPDEKNM
jgi:hypothetical protein